MQQRHLPPGYLPLGAAIHPKIDEFWDYEHDCVSVPVYRFDEELKTAIERHWQDGDLLGGATNGWKALKRIQYWEFVWVASDSGCADYYADVGAYRVVGSEGFKRATGEMLSPILVRQEFIERLAADSTVAGVAAPPDALAPSDKAATEIDPEKAYQTWLICKMRAWKPTKSKADYRLDAQHDLKLTISTRAYLRAWESAVVESGNRAWSKPGPRKS
jgi:hypothetical protein